MIFYKATQVLKISRLVKRNKYSFLSFNFQILKKSANHSGFIFLLLLFFTLSGLAQQYPFVHYTPKDGLVNNRSEFMYQDSKGLLYISTFGGLSVYDGSRFTNYTTDNGLAANMVNDIVEMGEDSIWIIPNSSKLHFLRKGKLKDLITSDGFYPVINRLIKCTDGFYYALADEGLFRFENDRFNRILLVDSAGKDQGRFLVRAIEINKRLFIITDINVQAPNGPGRLLVYDFKSKKVLVSYPLPALSVLSSAKGDILVSTKQGVKKIDELALSQNQIRFSSLPPIYKEAEKLVANNMYFDHNQNLWLCTERGVIKINQEGHLKLFTVENGLSVNFHESIFEDRENSMWFVNGQTGMSKLVNPQFEFYPQLKPGFSTSDMYGDDRSDSIWFLDAIHNKVLLKYGNDSREFQFDRNTRSLPYRYIAAHGSSVFVSDPFNVYQGHFSQKNEIQLKLLFAQPRINNDKVINCIWPDTLGDLVVSSDDLTVLRSNQKTEIYPLGYFSDKFVVTADNHLWTVSRGKKIFSFLVHLDSPDHALQILREFDNALPDMSPRSITVDKQQNLWVGSRNNGLFCYSGSGSTLKLVKQLTTKDGLSDDFISYLHTDDENNVWACSPGGLDKIEIKDGRFFIENITRSNNIYQFIVKIQTTKTGVHWVQTGAGIIRIAHSENEQARFQPKIIFREIYEGRNRISTQSGAHSLSYNENNLSFSMAAPSFIDEKQIRFSYLLEGGRTKSWSEPSEQASVSLANLEPGTYSLKAKAIFVNGRYQDTETSFSFQIQSPWWQSWWFRLLVVFLLAVFFGLMVRLYYRRKLLQQRMVLEKQQAIEKERTRIATDMHDDLGSGLSTIRFLSEKVKRNSISQSTREDMDRMQDTSNELIDKMSEIIWSMNERNDSLEDLLFYIRSYSMEYCEDNKLDCSIELPENPPKIFVSGEVRRNIFLTVKEGLHNIVKHAQAKNVTIVMETSNSLDITITDNGKGFKGKNETGTGNGLRNMLNRIESIGGRMSIQNENGTTLKLNVPVS